MATTIPRAPRWLPVEDLLLREAACSVLLEGTPNERCAFRIEHPARSTHSQLVGRWKKGYLLEREHTLSSDFLGHDSFGNAQFDTKRSELGLLEGAFSVDRTVVEERALVLVDDPYRSGATAALVAKGLVDAGAAAVYFLAMTKTRTTTVTDRGMVDAAEYGLMLARCSATT